MWEVEHWRVEAVDRPKVGVEWPSIEAEPTAEGVEDAVAVVDGDGDDGAVAVGNGAVAGVGLAAVPVVVVPVAHFLRCAAFSGKLQLSSHVHLVVEALVVAGAGVALAWCEAVAGAGW